MSAFIFQTHLHHFKKERRQAKVYAKQVSYLSTSRHN